MQALKVKGYKLVTVDQCLGVKAYNKVGEHPLARIIESRSRCPLDLDSRPRGENAKKRRALYLDE